MGGKKEIYRDVQFFHGALQLYIQKSTDNKFWHNVKPT